jgi:hypothetical protein
VRTSGIPATSSMETWGGRKGLGRALLDPRTKKKTIQRLDQEEVTEIWKDIRDAIISILPTTNDKRNHD